MEERLTVCANHRGMRLDKFLQANLNSYSRTKITELIHEDRVFVNGSVKKPSYRLKCGETVILKSEEKKETLKPFAFDVKIIYEDTEILVVDKPGGLTVHPAAETFSETLVNALLYLKKELSTVSPLRPGIVHRLDKETSGVMVLAKNNSSHLKLVEQFRQRKVKKEYFALVWGVINKNHLTVDLPLRRDEKNRLKMKISFIRSKKAYTELEVKERLSDSTFVSLKPLTGRMHQLRVHLKFLGFPILGDKKYGLKDDYGEMFLHAHKLGIYHPRTNEFMEFLSPIPERFEKFISEHR
jgi:23S rRNA pseudouridine1911/1915/1917 synthase